MEWAWNENKAASNWRDHRVLFETATLVFNDEHRQTLPDPHPDCDRWRTIGLADTRTLFVVHTEASEDDDEPGRIISARRATATERRAYEALRLKRHHA